MRSIARPSCPVCGDRGEIRYQRLRDLLFGTAGEWRLRVCSAPGCGCAWLDPAPLPEDLWQAYRSYYTHDESARRVHLPGSRGQQLWAARKLGYPRPAGWTAHIGALTLALRPRQRERALAARLFLPWVAQGRLLDVGCGSGAQIAAMRDIGWRVQGLEPDPAAVATARAAGLEVQQGDLLSVALPQASFDAISMVHVFEHLVEPARQLEACRRILVPGGRLVLITPNLAALGHRYFGADWRGLEPPRHLALHTTASVRASLQAAGLRPERLFTRAAGAARMLRISAGLRRARLRGAAQANERGGRFGDLRWRLLGAIERALVAGGLPLGEEIVALARNSD